MALKFASKRFQWERENESGLFYYYMDGGGGGEFAKWRIIWSPEIVDRFITTSGNEKQRDVFFITIRLDSLSLSYFAFMWKKLWVDEDLRD